MAYSNNDTTVASDQEDTARQQAKPSLSTLPADLFSQNIPTPLSPFPHSLGRDGAAKYPAVRGDGWENFSPYVSLSRVLRLLENPLNTPLFLFFFFFFFFLTKLYEKVLLTL